MHLPHKPRYATSELEATVSDEALDAFLGDLDDVWHGGSARGAESVASAHAYVQALCVPAQRKSMECLSARADANRHKFYQLISRSPWSWESLQDRLVEVGHRHGIFAASGGLYVDDTALPKSAGKHSVGVKRQYCGVLGKTANCQALPTLVWGAPSPVNRESRLWPLGMELYLPEEWARDADRREKASVPEAVEFETKAKIALRMIARVRERVAHSFIGADAGYGCDGDFRAQLREWNEPYVVGVRPTDIRCAPETRLVTPPKKAGRGRPRGPRLPMKAEPLSAHEWAKKAEWSNITWATGADDEPLAARVARFRVRVTVKAGRATDETGWLLLEERENELKAWICWGLDGSSLEDLVRMAHHRWTIEHAYETMKGELGLDHFEGRSWNGLHHHVSLVMLALAFLETQRTTDNKKGQPNRKTLVLAAPS